MADGPAKLCGLPGPASLSAKWGIALIKMTLKGWLKEAEWMHQTANIHQAQLAMVIIYSYPVSFVLNTITKLFYLIRTMICLGNNNVMISNILL